MKEGLQRFVQNLRDALGVGTLYAVPNEDWTRIEVNWQISKHSIYIVKADLSKDIEDWYSTEFVRSVVEKLREKQKLEEEATYYGEKANKGHIRVGKKYPGEGEAILRCGNTTVYIGLTLLSHLRFVVDSDSPVFADLQAAQKALSSITCEASLGRSGD